MVTSRNSGSLHGQNSRFTFIFLLAFLIFLPINPTQTQSFNEHHHQPAAEVEADAEHLLRSKRQFARYICGIPPYIFHSNWPCTMWGLCSNHGFTTNVPCGNNQTCLEHNPNTECVQGTCCTLPVVMPPPTTVSTTLWPWGITTAKSGAAGTIRQQGVWSATATIATTMLLMLIPPVMLSPPLAIPPPLPRLMFHPFRWT